MDSTSRTASRLPADPGRYAGAEARVAELCSSDSQVRAARPDPDTTAALGIRDLPLLDLVRTVMSRYADRPALGERVRQPFTHPGSGNTELRLLPEFATITYREVWTRAEAIATAWHHMRPHGLEAGDFVAICGFTSIDYTTVDLACLRFGAVAVPMQSSATVEELVALTAQVGPKVVACSVETLPRVVECVRRTPSVQRVIVFDYHPAADQQRDTVDAAGAALAPQAVDVVSLADVISFGRDLPAPPPIADAAAAERLSVLLFTSGSTGTPKGAIYTERMAAGFWRGIPQTVCTHPAITLTYLPMGHASGRLVLYGVLGSGGTVYFTAGSDLSTMFEDVTLVRPTEILFVPRFCEAVLQRCRAEWGAGGDTDRACADLGALSGALTKADAWPSLRERLLGGRLLSAWTGSAPLSTAMTNFMELLVGLPLLGVFGSTETGTIMLDGVVSRPPVLDYKLQDVPELGYHGTDEPFPRGELLLKSDSLFPGYYLHPEATASAFDRDGYYRTGDVMAEIGPDRLAYVDRRNNVLKLSQGEFVVVSRLEALFATCPLLQQVFLYGNSERPYLLAVVVPTEDALGGITPEELRLRIIESMRRTAKGAGLNSYEIPRDVLIEPTPFSTSNGLLTVTRKLARQRLVNHYRRRLERRYAELAERELQGSRAPSTSHPPSAALDGVVQAANLVLGLCDSAPADSRFVDIGGDSLSALLFANRLTQAFGVEVPVSMVIGPNGSFRRLAAYIDDARGTRSRRATAATVHGVDATSVRACDLKLEKLLPARTFEAARELQFQPTEIKTVLLTGANGYLGRFLCLGWLRRVAANGGRLICLVRGENAEEALRRLESVFETDPDLATLFAEHAEQHLEILSGDISEHQLGLADHTWQRLSESVDLIVHSAALVNHALPYAALFGPNVAGTAELIRLALSSRIKPISHVSTAAVLPGLDASAEDTDIRAVKSSCPLDGGYANGYVTSKWAGEVLLREAHEAFQLPVAVFRPGMVLAHSQYTGQLNVDDVFTRLVLSLLVTGLAPRSFHPATSRLFASCNALPAEVVADAITTIGETATQGHQAINLHPPHSDTVSLDVIVDWLSETGHLIQRVEDFDQWLIQFTAALHALPDQLRRRSILPVLHTLTDPATPVPPCSHSARTRRSQPADNPSGAESGEVAGVSRALVHKYAQDLRELHLM
ncbi:carboxylic acid reductase [Streptomyces sp. KS 21]|uniref:carboxylic acid reductase n=1 Tax=Streptomyces sp. KS 21 TaxID=2485150 RepID=UPI001063DFEA|nr:carboxylic acid reductase [Streptomyces sp. KS 21]TDU73567.1 fatty acid CoA ligase FadD9 [Streptomyces sp. KS 21]